MSDNSHTIIQNSQDFTHHDKIIENIDDIERNTIQVHINSFTQTHMKTIIFESTPYTFDMIIFEIQKQALAQNSINKHRNISDFFGISEIRKMIEEYVENVNIYDQNVVGVGVKIEKLVKKSRDSKNKFVRLKNNKNIRQILSHIIIDRPSLNISNIFRTKSGAQILINMTIVHNNTFAANIIYPLYHILRENGKTSEITSSETSGLSESFVSEEVQITIPPEDIVAVNLFEKTKWFSILVDYIIGEYFDFMRFPGFYNSMMVLDRKYDCLNVTSNRNDIAEVISDAKENVLIDNSDDEKSESTMKIGGSYIAFALQQLKFLGESSRFTSLDEFNLQNIVIDEMYWEHLNKLHVTLTENQMRNIDFFVGFLEYLSIYLDHIITRDKITDYNVKDSHYVWSIEFVITFNTMIQKIQEVIHENEMEIAKMIAQQSKVLNSENDEDEDDVEKFESDEDEDDQSFCGTLCSCINIIFNFICCKSNRKQSTHITTHKKNN